MTELNSTVGRVIVREAHEDGTLVVEIRPGDKWDLSSSGKSYLAAFGSDNVAVGGEAMRLAVTYTNTIPKHARSESAAKQKPSPFAGKARKAA